MMLVPQVVGKVQALFTNKCQWTKAIAKIKTTQLVWGSNSAFM